jgi:excisionase family DNA binding protein
MDDLRVRLTAVFAPDVLEAIEQLVEERVRVGLDARAPAGQDRRWLTVEQAAERLSCSPDAVRMRVRRGRLEHRRQGRRLYISAASIDDPR